MVVANDLRKIVCKKSLRNGDVNMIASTRPQSTVCARLVGFFDGGSKQPNKRDD